MKAYPIKNSPALANKQNDLNSIWYNFIKLNSIIKNVT